MLRNTAALLLVLAFFAGIAIMGYSALNGSTEPWPVLLIGLLLASGAAGLLQLLERPRRRD